MEDNERKPRSVLEEDLLVSSSSEEGRDGANPREGANPDWRDTVPKQSDVDQWRSWGVKQWER